MILQVKLSDMRILLFVILFSHPFSISQNQAITPDQLREWVNYLASDDMKGRRNGSSEMKEVAAWLAGKFEDYGLKNLNGDGSFIYEYDYTFRSVNISERNVIGIIEGSDPKLKHEFIILSAHFDHIGIRRGEPVDSICNGADDNASGTAALLGIAKYLHDTGTRTGRSIIFASFSGEENGMRGSRNFTANLPFKPGDIYANMNFEMIGHSEELGRGKYYMTGCPYSNLDDIVGSYAPALELIDTIPITNALFNSSDNISFSRLAVADGVTTGIPSGTFATTTMAEYIHSVDDEAGLFDFENMALLVNHFADIVIRLSKEKQEVKWTDPRWRRP